MTNAMTAIDPVVEREIRIAARRRRCSSISWTLSGWRAGSAAATLDARPGGDLRISVPDQHASGQFVEVDPPRRLVFTWGWAEPVSGPAGRTRVEIDLALDGDDTVLRLRHAGLGPDLSGDMAQGWQHYLDRLAIVASGGDPGPDPMADQAQGAGSVANG